jgi:formiminotetrahydrofolate cyclodeaminase
MVARLTRGREKYADFEATAIEVEAAAEAARGELLELADLDARAYLALVAARRMARASETDREARRESVERAAARAVGAPLRIARLASTVTALAARLAGSSNPNAASDVGAATHLAAAAARGAALNVRINVPALRDDDPLRDIAASELDALLSDVERDERAALEQVGTTLG